MSSTGNITSRYKVTVYSKADKFIGKIPESNRKTEALRLINDLQNFPFIDPAWHIENLGGRDDAWRIRIGRYRIGFVVDKPAKEIIVYQAAIK